MATKLKPMQRNDHRRMVMPTDRNLREKCDDLRHAVEHPNESGDIILQQGIYKRKDPEAILTIKVDGVEVGYKVKPSSPIEINPYFDRYVYLKIPGYRMSDLSVKQLVSIKTALYDAFLEPQGAPIKVGIIGEDAMLMVQRFMVCFPVQMAPGLVSKIGGVNIDNKGVILNG